MFPLYLMVLLVTEDILLSIIYVKVGVNIALNLARVSVGPGVPTAISPIHFGHRDGHGPKM